MAWTLLIGDEVLVGPMPSKSVQITGARCVQLRAGIHNVENEIRQLQDQLTDAVGGQRASIVGNIKRLWRDVHEMEQESRSRGCP
jgi:hypothetical protein